MKVLLKLVYLIIILFYHFYIKQSDININPCRNSYRTVKDKMIIQRVLNSTLIKICKYFLQTLIIVLSMSAR